MRPKLTYANVTATLALIIAVGGASAFAATQLPRTASGEAAEKERGHHRENQERGGDRPQDQPRHARNRAQRHACNQGGGRRWSTPHGTGRSALKGSYPNPELVGPACPAGTLYIEGACLETVTRTTAKLGGAIEACRARWAPTTQRERVAGGKGRTGNRPHVAGHLGRRKLWRQRPGGERLGQRAWLGDGHCSVFPLRHDSPALATSS